MSRPLIPEPLPQSIDAVLDSLADNPRANAFVATEMHRLVRPAPGGDG